MKGHARENLNPYALCGRESYQGTTERDAEKGLLSRIYITVLCVAKDLYPRTTQRDTQRVLLDRVNISVFCKRIVKTSKIFKKKKCMSKIAK